MRDADRGEEFSRSTRPRSRGAHVMMRRLRGSVVMSVSDRRPLILSLIPLLCLTACPSDGDDSGNDGFTVGLDTNQATEGEASNTNSESNDSNGDGDGDGDDGDGDSDPGDGDGDDDDDDGGSNTKFDLAPIGDLGDGQTGLGGPGSCRASETY